MSQEIKIRGVGEKKVKNVSVVNEAEFRCVTIDFTDGTSLQFSLYATLNVTPELLEWKTGDSKPLRKYPMVSERTIGC